MFPESKVTEIYCIVPASTEAFGIKLYKNAGIIE